MVGGAGNDTFVVDHTGVVINATQGGTDAVRANISYTLGTSLDNLTLTGTSSLFGQGNTGDNIITANSAGDTLDGGTAGTDTLVGGTGNDTFVIDHTGVVINATQGGTDTVSASISYTLGAHLDNLTLTGTNSLTGTGNVFANIITANSAGDTLDGGQGNDTIYGGSGSDVYQFSVGDGKDVVMADPGGTNIVNIGTSYDNIAIFKNGTGANTTYTLSYSADNSAEVTFKTTGSGINLQINDDGSNGGTHYITQTEIDKIITDINTYATTHTGITSVEAVMTAMQSDDAFKTIITTDWHT